MFNLTIKLAMLSALLFGLPLLGVVLNAESLAPYLEFPPLTRYVDHAPFSWYIFTFTTVVALLLLIGLAWLIRLDFRATRTTPTNAPTHPWPWWGWLGIVTLGISWLMAWTRFSWFSDLQPYTFTPLWLSYIVVINAWTYRLSGRCLLLHRPRFLVALFPLSALFWWYFEYLNRFVQNWYYVGIEEFGAVRYVLHATLAFSTVLPAVISTTNLLANVLRPSSTPVTLTFSKRKIQILSAIALSFSALGLMGLGIWPDYLFPFLWFTPLLLLLAFQGLYGEPTLLRQLRSRGWQAIYLPALAALQCGFFWELWNYYSEAKWIYSIPFVHRYQIFEMPLLGYTGYLPFGIECAVIALLLNNVHKAYE